MSASEKVLIAAMIFFPTRYQRTLLLEKYVQQYGALSEEAGEEAKKLLKEARL